MNLWGWAEADEAVAVKLDGKTATTVADDQGNSGLVAIAFSDGRVKLLHHHYSTDFSAGVELRKIVPALNYPYGRDQRVLMPGGGITGLAMSDNESELVLAASASGGRVRVEWSSKQENFLSGDITLESTIKAMDVDFEISAITISINAYPV